jgi:C4-dicarboxylate-binding protein DctP
MKSRYVGYLVFVLVLAIAMILPACATSAPQEMPTLKWTLGTSEPNKADWDKKPLLAFADNIASRTGGKWTVRVTIGDELGVANTEYPIILSKGQIQMGFLAGGHITGTIPHESIYGLPFLVGASGDVLVDGQKVTNAIRSISVREWSKLGISPAAFFVSTPVQLISKAQINDMSNFNNTKIRAWDELTSNVVKALNGVPIVMAASETYLALQRGVIDGVLTGPPAMGSMSLWEYAKYLYLINLPPACVYIGQNDAAVKALPDAYKKIYTEELATMNEAWKKAQPTAAGDAITFLKSKGVTAVTIPPDQMAKIVTAVKPLWEAWAAKGPTQKEAYDAALKALGIK